MIKKELLTLRHRFNPHITFHHITVVLFFLNATPAHISVGLMEGPVTVTKLLLYSTAITYVVMAARKSEIRLGLKYYHDKAELYQVGKLLPK